MKKLAILISFLAVGCTSTQGYNYDEGAHQAYVDLAFGDEQNCKFYVGSMVKDIRNDAIRKILNENNCTYMAADYSLSSPLDDSVRYYHGYNEYVIEYFTEKDY